MITTRCRALCRGVKSTAASSIRVSMSVTPEIKKRTRDEAIERERSGTARQDEQEDRRPHQMLDPLLGIDEDLDDEGHAQHRQSSKPGRETENQEHRASELDGGREAPRDFRRRDRYGILVPEQRDGGLPPPDLTLSSIPKYQPDPP